MGDGRRLSAARFAERTGMSRATAQRSSSHARGRRVDIRLSLGSGGS